MVLLRIRICTNRCGVNFTSYTLSSVSGLKDVKVQDNKVKMSKFEDYSEVSKVYDKERTAMGADTIAGLLHVYGGKPLKDLHVLDAGCGTGNYAKALIDFGVGKMTLMDGSSHMLEKAKEKLKDEIDKKVVDKVIEAKMPPLPFADGSFDVVLFSLVLHHLTDRPNGEDFPEIEAVFRETKRVLRPKGIMVVIEVLPTTRHAMWYTKLHESLCDRYCKMFPTVNQYLAMFDKCGFHCPAKFNILGTELIKDYFDPEGPLKKEWRKSISLYGYATEQEIMEIEQFVREMKDKGILYQFMKENDRTLEIGLLTVFLCVSV